MLCLRIAIAALPSNHAPTNVSVTLDPVSVLRGHDGIIEDLSFAPDVAGGGTRLATTAAVLCSVGTDCALRIWDRRSSGSPAFTVRLCPTATCHHIAACLCHLEPVVYPPPAAAATTGPL